MPDLLGENRPVFDASRFPPPRDFQDKAHNTLREGARAGNKRQLLMSPTGSGKTYLALRAIAEALQRGRRAMFICDRLTLLDQTSATADRYGLSCHGIYQADHWRTDHEMPFQIASTQTLDSRGMPPGKFHLGIVDECHTKHKGWTERLDEFDYVIGLSATPFTKGLGTLFTNLVNAATMAELVDAGVLVPMRVLSLTKPNMKDAPKSDGEWTAGGAGDRGIAIVGDVVPEYEKHGEERKAIYFGATIAHCEELCRQFNEAGIMASVFCADTPASEREAILKEYRKPNSMIRVLISVEALAKGFDVPDVRLIGDCRPLRKGLSTFIQMLGRGLRSSEATGKTDCILLDHSGNIVRFADDFSDIYWNGLSALDTEEPLDSTARKDVEDRDVKSCPKCGYSPFGKRCISCGFKALVASTIQHEVASGVREIIIGKRRLADNREHLFQQFVSYCTQNGKPETAKQRASHAYREAMGSWPPDYFSFSHAAAAKVPVTKEVRDRMRAQMVAYRKTIGAR